MNTRQQLQVPRLLRVHEVAERTGIQQWRLYAMIAQGEGPPVLRIGRTIRISEAALVEWIARSSTSTVPGREQ